MVRHGLSMKISRRIKIVVLLIVPPIIALSIALLTAQEQNTAEIQCNRISVGMSADDVFARIGQPTFGWKAYPESKLGFWSYPDVDVRVSIDGNDRVIHTF